jgi:hypothetical protein
MGNAFLELNIKRRAQLSTNGRRSRFFKTSSQLHTSLRIPRDSVNQTKKRPELVGSR